MFMNRPSSSYVSQICGITRFPFYSTGEEDSGGGDKEGLMGWLRQQQVFGGAKRDRTDDVKLAGYRSSN
jgi:hypothetical protein